MTKKTQRLHKLAKLPLAMAVAATMSTPASAFQFYIGDMEASLDSTISAGASWRIEEADDELIGLGNGGSGGSLNSDNGNLNFENDKTYSKIIKGNSDFLVTYEDYGLFARAKYWYDFELKDETDGLSAEGKANASGAEFLDAYVWGDFWLTDDIPLNMRFGYQVVSWGESTFIFNGINVINPVNIGAIRAPGSEVKEALLPVPMLYGSLGLTENITLEAFVQLRHETAEIEDCGTLFSAVDYVADGCSPVTIATSSGDQFSLDNGYYLHRVEDREASDADQFGMAVRWFVPELNETELGFYFIQYHSRLPTVGGRVAATPGLPGGINSDLGAAYFIEYPERIQLFGLSFNTMGPWGVSLGGEYSFKKDAPIQLNSNDLVAGALGVEDNVIFQDRVPDVDGDGFSTVAEAAATGFLGSDQSGYDLYDISQIQFTGIKFFDQVAGASRLSLVGEIGATYVHDFPDAGDGGIRYGRYDMAGSGISPTGVCTGDSDACTSDGYVTEFSWGYRARASLKYNDVFAGVNLTPQLAWSHDVEGYAPGPGGNFIEDRQSVGLSLKADYLNQYSATLGYTSFFGAEPYNPRADRDNASVSVSYSF